MKKSLLFNILFVFCFNTAMYAKTTPTQLRCEYLENPSVVDVLTPRLSWINIADKGDRGQKQTAWEVRVASSNEKLLHSTADLWNSGKVTSTQSTNVRYA